MDIPSQLIVQRYEAVEDSGATIEPTSAQRGVLHSGELFVPNKALSVLGVSNLGFLFAGYGQTTGAPVSFDGLTFHAEIVGWPGRAHNKVVNVPAGSILSSIKGGYPHGRVLFQGTLTFGTLKHEDTHPFHGIAAAIRDYYFVDTIAVDSGFDVSPKKRCNYNIYDGGGDNGMSLLELDVQNMEAIHCYLHTVHSTIKACGAYGLNVAAFPMVGRL